MVLLLRSLRSEMAALLASIILIATLVVYCQGNVGDSEMFESSVVRRGLSALNFGRPFYSTPANNRYPTSGSSYKGGDNTYKGGANTYKGGANTYKGGANTIYRAGELPDARSPLQPVLFPVRQVETHFPGYWGPQAYLFLYQYEANIESVNHTSKRYIVHCYCIQQEECSCGQGHHRDYFNNLSPKTAMVEGFKNLTRVYINGTEDLADYTSGGRRNSTCLQLVAVAILMSLFY